MDRVEEELLKLDLLTDEVKNPEQLLELIKGAKTREDWAKVNHSIAKGKLKHIQNE